MFNSELVQSINKKPLIYTLHSLLNLLGLINIISIHYGWGVTLLVCIMVITVHYMSVWINICLEINIKYTGTD